MTTKKKWKEEKERKQNEKNNIVQGIKANYVMKFPIPGWEPATLPGGEGGC